MAMKCIGILMMVTIELYILIASTSFTHLAPIMLPQFYKLDKAISQEHPEPKLPLHSCIARKYEYCKESKKYGVPRFSYGDRLFNGFIDCLYHFEPSAVIESCVFTCWRQHTMKNIFICNKSLSIFLNSAKDGSSTFTLISLKAAIEGLL
jgi:hypothetical protein